MQDRKLSKELIDYCLNFLVIDFVTHRRPNIDVKEEEKWIYMCSVIELVESPPPPSDNECINYMLSHLLPNTQSRSWRERLKTDGFKYDPIAISRINSFICKSVIRSPLKTSAHLRRIFDAATSRRLKGKYRSTDMILPILDLEKYEHKIVALEYLEKFLSDRSHDVVGTSLFVINEMVDKFESGFPSEFRNRLITAIQKNCMGLKIRNYMMFGGLNNVPMSTVKHMATSALIKLKQS